jgi:hypothetical protein
MMTFVTSSNLVDCAHSLDYRRLGKQRVEAYQILRTLRGHSHGWKNHPAVKMWRGYDDALALYMNAMIDEWIARGYKNTMKKEDVRGSPKFPWWFAWKPLHDSHKASLNRKMPSWYSFDVDDVFTKHGYIWPSVLDDIRGRSFFMCEVCDCLE